MNKNYDQKLRKAMAEITEVLERYDIGGMVALAGRDHMEYKMHIEPTWSLARYVRNGEAVHIKIHHSKQPQLNQTSGMIYGFRDLASLFFQQTDHMAELIAQHSNVQHVKFGSGINNDDRDPVQ